MRSRKAVSKAEPEMSEREARNLRMREFAGIADAFKTFRPASEVLTRVRAVPTIFPQFDHITRVGGLPIERFSLLHGASGGGKTYWTIGLMLSFLMRNHFAVLIDAERTTPISWLEKAMGEFANHPFFFADRPKTYESTVQSVRHFLNTLRKERDAGRVAPDTTALIVVDSIRKLIPKDQFDRIMKSMKAAGDKDEKLKDRSAQIKAAMNAAWMDEIIPLLEETQSAMLVIAREIVDADAPPPRAFGGRAPEKKVTVGGGAALYYDASMNMRSTLLKSYGKKIVVNGQDRMVPYGDLHQIEISKSKVSGKGESFKARCTYHISNGVWSPVGFDRSRDLIELARSFDIIEGTSWLKFGSWKRQGEDAAVKGLNENPKLFAEIEAACREHMVTKQETTR